MATIKNSQIGLCNSIDSRIRDIKEELKPTKEKVNSVADTLINGMTVQSKINTLTNEKVNNISQNVKRDEHTFELFLDACDAHRDYVNYKLTSLEKDCNRYKRNSLLGFIGSGIIDIILCITIIAQMYS